MFGKTHDELTLVGVLCIEEGERYTGEGRDCSVAGGGNIWLEDIAR